MAHSHTVVTTGRLYRDVYVVGDIHGSRVGLEAILEHAGLAGGGRWRGRRAHVVQCGDIIDRGSDSRACLELLLDLRRQAYRAGGRVDLLVGNHELALACGDYSISDVPQPEALSKTLAQAIRGGRLQAARSYRQYLMTHAGVNPQLMLRLIGEVRREYGRRVTVASLARYLNQQLKLAFATGDFRHPMFHVGVSRGGSHDLGGIFWADFDFDHDQVRRHPRVWQIFGHTPPKGRDPFRVTPDERRVNIDVGICGHYGGYHAYVKLLPDRIVGIHCQSAAFAEDILAAITVPSMA